MADGSGNGTFVPDASNHRAFRHALGRFATGVVVVTCATPDGPLGFTANSFAALSLEPPLVLWSPAKSSSRYPVLVAAEHFAIHVLRAGQEAMMHRFVRGGAGFAGLDHGIGPDGVPLIHDTLARFECARHEVFDGGDHSIVVGRVLRAEMADGPPLVFSAGHYGTFAG